MNRMMLAFAGAIAFGGLASPACAELQARTKLVRCGDESCLRIAGHRDDPASSVRINGRSVAVEGERRWRVYLPIEDVRAWSAPHARTIDVSLSDPGTQRETTASVDLPIGLLGNTTELASLVISAE